LQLNDSQTNSAAGGDFIRTIALDANGNLFIAGYTMGSLGGINAGNRDGFIGKLNSTTGIFDSTFGDGDGNDDDGILQLNDSQTNSAVDHDQIKAIALDLGGNLLVTGDSYSSLGGVNAGSSDGFIVKLNTTTAVLDSVFGNGDGNDGDGILQLNVSQSNSAASEDTIRALALDSNGNLFVAGSTRSALGGTNAGLNDGFIAKFNATTGVFDSTFGDGDGFDNDGILQLNASQTYSAISEDIIYAIALDANDNLYVAGVTYSSLDGVNAGMGDGFIAKLSATTGVFDSTFGNGDGIDGDGILQLNASQTNSANSDDYISAISLDANGNLFVAGPTASALGGANSGFMDGFIAKLDATTGAFDNTFGDGDGNDDDGILQLNNSQTNSATFSDDISALALDTNGNLFLAGSTASALGGANAGGKDGFIAKLNATTGILDSTFGDGDGHDDDGILQLNNSQTSSAILDDTTTALVLDTSGHLFVGGSTESGMGGVNAGDDDGIILMADQTTGEISQ
jgi:hypothetical protein